MVYRLYVPPIFANARYVMARIRELVDQSPEPIECLVIDAQAISHRDITAAQRFAELHHELTAEGVDIKIADTPRPFREQLIKFGLIDRLGDGHVYVLVKKAVESYRYRIENKDEK